MELGIDLDYDRDVSQVERLRRLDLDLDLPRGDLGARDQAGAPGVAP
jgi:hypothetical protein